MDTNEKSIEPYRVLRTKKEDTHICVCPNCGHESFKNLDHPCTAVQCPVCDSRLVDK